MAELESILSKLLLSLQFCLAFWQIVKLTMFGAFIKAFMSRCMSKLPCRLRTLLSPSYTRLKEFEEEVFFFIKVGVCLCLATNEADQPTVTSEVPLETEIRITYLGKDIHLERRDRHKLFVDGEMAYYITDPIWHSLLDLKRVDSRTVFLKGHKVLLGRGLIAGGLMDLPEVLDGLILRNGIIKPILFQGNHFPFIPIDLSVSEEKLLKGLNLVGLFLQTKKQVYWLIPTLLSFTSAVMEFCTPLRVWIYTNVNRIFCWAMHPLCDHLPLVARVWIYNLLEWVENLKPSNNFEWRVVRGVKHAVIGGGAKACSQTSSLVQPSSDVEIPRYVQFYSEGKYTLEVLLKFDANKRKISGVMVNHRGYRFTFLRDCEEDKYKHMRTFIECLMKSKSGSLECCDPKGRVCRVRSLEESLSCYIKNGFPQVYELKLENAIVM